MDKRNQRRVDRLAAEDLDTIRRGGDERPVLPFRAHWAWLLFFGAAWWVLVALAVRAAWRLWWA